MKKLVQTNPVRKPVLTVKALGSKPSFVTPGMMYRAD